VIVRRVISPCVGDWVKYHAVGGPEGAFLRARDPIDTHRRRSVFWLSGGGLDVSASLLGCSQVLPIGVCDCPLDSAYACVCRLVVNQRTVTPNPLFLRKFAKVMESFKRKCSARGGGPTDGGVGLAEFVEDSYAGEKLQHYREGIAHFIGAGVIDVVRNGLKSRDVPTIGFTTFVKNELQDVEACLSRRLPQLVDWSLESCGRGKGNIVDYQQYSRTEAGLIPAHPPTRPRGIQPQVFFDESVTGGWNLLPCAIEGAALARMARGKKTVRSDAGNFAFNGGHDLRMVHAEVARLVHTADVPISWVKIDVKHYESRQGAYLPIVRAINLKVIRAERGEDDVFCWLRDLVYPSQDSCNISARGVTARTPPIRMSGTAATSFDNQSVMYVLLQCVFRLFECRNRCYIAGDDAYVGLPVEWWSVQPSQRVKDRLQRFGLSVLETEGVSVKLFELAFEKIAGIPLVFEGRADDPMMLPFCRLYAYTSPVEKIYVKRPQEVLRRLMVVTRTDGGRPDWSHHFSVCCGYLGVWSKVPLVSDMARAVAVGISEAGNYRFVEKHALESWSVRFEQVDWAGLVANIRSFSVWSSEELAAAALTFDMDAETISVTIGHLRNLVGEVTAAVRHSQPLDFPLF